MKPELFCSMHMFKVHVNPYIFYRVDSLKTIKKRNMRKKNMSKILTCRFIDQKIFPHYD